MPKDIEVYSSKAEEALEKLSDALGGRVDRETLLVIIAALAKSSEARHFCTPYWSRQGPSRQLLTVESGLTRVAARETIGNVLKLSPKRTRGETPEV